MAQQVDHISSLPTAAAAVRRRSVRRILTLVSFLGPAGLFLAVLIAAALMALRMSVSRENAESAWTVASYGALGAGIYLSSMLLTLKLSLLSTMIAVVLSLPVAMVLARLRNDTVRSLMLFVVLLPLLMNVLFQVYGWMVILSPGALVDSLAGALGLNAPLLLYNQPSVLIGLVQSSFPLAVLPITNALRNIPMSIEEAAATLGGNRVRTLWHIVFPLSMPGIVAASLLVFAFNASDWVIALLLGGDRVTTMGVLIRDEMGPLLNWPIGSALGTVLVVATLIILAVYQRLTSRYAELWRT
jgi:putative spermidine/putrescine transport system permease protein